MQILLELQRDYYLLKKRSLEMKKQNKERTLLCGSAGFVLLLFFQVLCYYVSHAPRPVIELANGGLTSMTSRSVSDLSYLGM